MKKYRETHKEEIKGYNQKNKEKKRLQHKAWTKENPDYYKEYEKTPKRKEYLKKYRQENKEMLREKNKEYERKPKRKEYHKEYYQENIEKYKKLNKEWEKNNKDKRVSYVNQSHRKHPEKLKARRMAQYKIPFKSACEICGDTNNLQRHHWNYDKPLMVNTLCSFCHNVQHQKNIPLLTI